MLQDLGRGRHHRPPVNPTSTSRTRWAAMLAAQLGRLRRHAPAVRWLSSTARPPPPPPPPRKKAMLQHTAKPKVAAATVQRPAAHAPSDAAKKHGRRGAGGGASGTGPFMVLGAVALGALAIQQFNQMAQEKASKGPSWAAEGVGEASESAPRGTWMERLTGNAPKEPEPAARNYLQELAEKGDEHAKRVLESAKVAEAKPADEYRFDESTFNAEEFKPQLSVDTLEAILNAKRKEERAIRERSARRQFAFAPDRRAEAELANIRAEKQEIKDQIKQLRKEERQAQAAH